VKILKVFKIIKDISNKLWGNIDKSRIWQLLKQGIEESSQGITEAVREVYAVVKTDINKSLTETDCWGPHHEVAEDGSIQLNRSGLVAAAAAIAGARTAPSLTPSQIEQAKQHLLNHYNEIDLPIPVSLGGKGETVSLKALVTGEIRVSDVPLASWVDLNALKVGDSDPLEVVVKVPAGKSKRDWNYMPEALQRIVGEVMRQGLPGFQGHQKPEDVDHEFPIPVTHWVGAMWKNGAAYFRGVVDKAADDLKRWIRAKTVRTVSIFGIPKLQQVSGETRVVDYHPLSIDWTPLGRAGMPTEIVAIGEMDEIIIGGVDPIMKWSEILAAIRAGFAAGEITKSQVLQLASELGFKVQDIAGEMDANWYKSITVTGETLDKVKKALNINGEMDVVKVAEDAGKALVEQNKSAHIKLLDGVLKEKVTGEMAQGLIKKMLIVPENATKEQIAGEIDKLLADASVKEAFSKLHVDKPVHVGGGSGNSTGGLLVTKKVSI
jgi:hypothetical protein